VCAEGDVVAERRVFVHIGAPKTGTTYLQEVLHRNRDALRDAGLLYPEGRAHHAPVWDLRGGLEDGDHGEGIAGRWAALVEEVRGWPGDAVISSEMFVFVDEERASTIVSTFADDLGAEVHVVYTARDLVRQVPAVWQEQVKNRRTLPYAKFCADVVGRRRTRLGRHFWRAQDAPAALARWSAAGVPAHRVHVVTMPPSGTSPDVLWGRFAGVLGVDPAAYDSHIPPSNESLSVTAVETLRRYNQRHAEGMGIRRYRAQVQQPLMPALTGAVGDTERLPLTYAHRKRLAAHGEKIAKTLRKAGYDVVGSLDELVPAKPDRAARHATVRGPGDLSDAELLDAALDVVHHLLQERAAQTGTRPPAPPPTV
jgi:hypothetical protein